MRLVLIKFWRQRLEIMLFNSIAFICLFLPVIFILYYLLPGKIKDIALVAGGAVFFAWGAPVNLVVLAFFILFNYAVGIQMEGYMRRRRSTEQLFAGSILINIIVYVFFAFIGQRVGFISEVPVGIGICILQVLSYLIEIHRGNVKAQKSILDFAVYIAMFPLFLAGPVVKYPQIRKELKTRKLSWAKAGEGIVLFVCGFAKKVIIADYLADSFTKIMSLKAGELSVFGAWLGCATFMFQIYFAFSGYCDMAVGLCRMLGFDVKKNFRYPYVARNITTFVRRFNSSVFAWFWDYICEPLWGGWLGTLVSGILMGLWYAGMWKNAPWQVTVTGGLLWGIYLAFWQIVERYALPFLKRLPPVLGQIYTWFFTALGWVYSGDYKQEIQPESFSEGESFEKDGNQITVDIANPDTTAKPVAECLIGGIHIDTSTAEGQNIYVGLPNGVTLQQSLMEDAESIYGAPKDRYEADTSVQFTYEYGLYQTITLGFDNETGILYSLDMQNFTTTADAEALDGVSDATTPEVEAYQAPEADSSEINDWTVRFDDVLYHLPVPVSELLDHDWTVNMKESDTAVLNGKYGYVTLEKGGQKLYCTVHNYGA